MWSSSNPFSNRLMMFYILLLLFVIKSRAFGQEEEPTVAPTSDPPNGAPASMKKNPTNFPSVVPTKIPSCTPTRLPTIAPTFIPSYLPTYTSSETPSPTIIPTETPSIAPSFPPAESPIYVSLTSPTEFPSVHPTYSPSEFSTYNPTQEPTTNPSFFPSQISTQYRSTNPTTFPSFYPTMSPTIFLSQFPSLQQSQLPTTTPTYASNIPSFPPSQISSHIPTESPSIIVSIEPTIYPSETPSMFPSVAPTVVSTVPPSVEYSILKTSMPTSEASASSVLISTSVNGVTSSPSMIPTTVYPTEVPSVIVTETPSPTPTSSPTTVVPSFSPTIVPSCVPSTTSSLIPTIQPTPRRPTASPSSGPSPLLLITTLSSSLEHVDVTETLMIRSVIIVRGSTCNAKWILKKVNESSSMTIDLTEMTIVPYFQSNTVIGRSYPINLWLRANTLEPQRFYSFQLNCGNVSVSVSAYTNGAPSGGMLSVTPMQGVELQTVFQFNSILWQDDSLPLTFDFGIYLANGGRLRLRNRDLSANFSQLLPRGSQNSNLTVFSFAYDVYNASTEATTSVRVLNLPLEEAQSNVLSRMTSSLVSGTDTEILQSLALASAIFSDIDCSDSPNCTSLNRQGCTLTSHTCGACLPGYVASIQEDSNIPCISWTDIHRTEKPCPENCFNHGKCQQRDIRTGKVVSSCIVSNATCEAVCVCDPGYGDESCDRRAADITVKQNATTTVLSHLPPTDMESVVSTTNGLIQRISDVNVDGVQSMVLSLSSALTNYVTQTQMGDIADALGMLTTLFRPISLALEVVTTANDSNSKIVSVWQTLSMLQQLGDVVGANMIPGQDLISLVYGDLRFIGISLSAATVLNNIASDLSYKVSIPITPVENLTNTIPSYVQIEPDAIREDTSAVSVQMFQLQPEFFNSSMSSKMLALPVIIQTEDLETVLIHMQSTRTVAMNMESHNFTTACRVGQNDTVSIYACPGSGTRIVHQCRNRNEVFLSFCPQERLVCASIDANEGGDTIVTQNDNCYVVSQLTDNFVKCRCNLTYNDAMRRRLSSSERQGTAAKKDVLILTSIVTYTSFDSGTSYRIPAEVFNSNNNMQRAVTVYVMFASLWLVGLFVLFGCSYRVRANQAVYKKEKDRKVALSLEENRSPAVIYSKMQDYVQKVFPSVFSQSISLIRLKEELQRNHRWLYFFTPSTGPESDRKRLVLGAKLLTFQSMLMFLLSLFYDIQGPGDDGSCGSNVDKVSCLERKSLFDTDHDYCIWIPITVSVSNTVSAASGVCMYDETSITFTAGLYAFVLVAVMSSLVARPLEYLFDVLAAPTTEDIKLKLSESTVSRIGRRLTHVARRATEIATTLGQTLNRASARTTYLRVKSGQQTRDIPEDVQTAHRAAYASLRSVSDTVQSQLVERVMHRLRVQNSFLNLNISEDEEHNPAQIDQSVCSCSSDTSSDDDRENSHINREELHVHNHNHRHHHHHHHRCHSNGKSTELQPVSITTTSLPLTVTASTTSMPSPPFTWIDRIWGLITNPLASPPSPATKLLIEKNFHILCQLIRKQRNLLQDKEREEYDLQWGLDTVTGDFLRENGTKTRSCWEWKYRETTLLIYQEMFTVHLAGEQKIQQLQSATDAHAGLEILHIFILDLLGRDTTAAKIFLLKSEEDFQHVRVVSRPVKFFAGALLVGANLFFAYFAVLLGYTKSAEWQHSYLIGCILQFIVDVCLLETIECLWINFFLPSLVASDVSKASDLLSETLAYLCAQSSDILNGSITTETVSPRIFLNAPDFLFVSMHIARMFPSLLESMIVQSYQQYLPGELARKWHPTPALCAPVHRYFPRIQTEKEEMKDKSTGTTWQEISIVRFVFTCLRFMATFPFFLQKIVLRILQPFLLGGLVYIWFEHIQHNVAYVVIFTVAIGVSILTLIWSFYQEAKRVQLLDPHSIQLANIAAVGDKKSPLNGNTSASSPVSPVKKQDKIMMVRENVLTVVSLPNDNMSNINNNNMLLADDEDLHNLHMHSPYSSKDKDKDEKKTFRNRMVSFPHYDSPNSTNKKNNYNSMNLNNDSTNFMAGESPSSAIIGRKSFSAIPSNAAVLDAMSVAVARANRTRTESGAGLLAGGGFSHSNSNDSNDITNNTSNDANNTNNNSPFVILSPQSQKKASFKVTVEDGMDADDEGVAQKVTHIKRMIYDDSNSNIDSNNKLRNQLLSIVSDTSSPSPTSNQKQHHIKSSPKKQRIIVSRHDCNHSSDEDEKQHEENDNNNDNNNEDAHSLSTVSLYSIGALQDK